MDFPRKVNTNQKKMERKKNNSIWIFPSAYLYTDNAVICYNMKCQTKQNKTELILRFAIFSIDFILYGMDRAEGFPYMAVYI